MLNWIMTKIVGTKSQRDVKKLLPLVDTINGFEPSISELTDEQLRAKTDEFKERLAGGATLDDILSEAFAVVREAAHRAIGERPYDVQLMGGIVLHQGKIAEMMTGEGKTLVATMPLYLNALTGKGVHLVTVNDYLARRDCDWMSPIFEMLGLTVGAIQHDMETAERQEQYGCDITYGTNNEFGFDYLRDNMVPHKSLRVQRSRHYVIVDEVDSVLIDEARTPLIISGPSEEKTDRYYEVNRIIPKLRAERDYIVEEKHHQVTLTEEGMARVESLLKIPDLFENSANLSEVHLVNQALRAHTLFKKEVNYIVKDDEVIIVDEFTGRLMPGRRYSDGLHQALEAKENVRIQSENQTLATITFQNFFKLYDKLAGMTGTADTESAEFMDIYKLDVVVIPPNRPLQRIDYPDVVYKSEQAKFNAAVEEIVECNRRGQPVLVGTISIDKSELLSRMLKRRGVPHHVLNAKHHEREAEIVAAAGQPGAVTISTNMAGRGTDIKLGEGVPELGGLHVLGTERHEARRIDNQLRGRSGRQGDPGSSIFYLSLEDDLMRLFGSERIRPLMERLGMRDEDVIEHRMVARSIEKAQKRVEGMNFGSRKRLLEYDNVMNMQRTYIYGMRNDILDGENMDELVAEAVSGVLQDTLPVYIGDDIDRDDWDIEALRKWVENTFRLSLNMTDDEILVQGMPGVEEHLAEIARKEMDLKVERLGPEFTEWIRAVMLHVVDSKWKEHLYVLDHLKQAVSMRGYGGRDPLVEYKHESYEEFVSLIKSVQKETVEILYRVQAVEREPVPVRRPDYSRLTTSGPTESAQSQFSGFGNDGGRHGGDPTSQPPQRVEQRRVGTKVGRNDPCPCGSGKKYKKCCGR
ncbi:MAG: preprotein translocase subunit SecA [Candidatus Hydrogenedentes bacterium]|nr:preprotein translocase subunit SecA [Candidatus Hydrogenedentota bacterium]